MQIFYIDSPRDNSGSKLLVAHRTCRFFEKKRNVASRTFLRTLDTLGVGDAAGAAASATLVVPLAPVGHKRPTTAGDVVRPSAYGLLGHDLDQTARPRAARTNLRVLVRPVVEPFEREASFAACGDLAAVEVLVGHDGDGAATLAAVLRRAFRLVRVPCAAGAAARSHDFKRVEEVGFVHVLWPCRRPRVVVVVPKGVVATVVTSLVGGTLATLSRKGAGAAAGAVPPTAAAAAVTGAITHASAGLGVCAVAGRHVEMVQTFRRLPARRKAATVAGGVDVDRASAVDGQLAAGTERQDSALRAGAVEVGDGKDAA